MVLPNQIQRLRRSFSFALLAIAFAFSSDHAKAQQTTDTTATTGGTGTQFQAAEVDMSAFEGIERGDSVGASTVQGFGLTAEASGASAGPAGGGGGGGGFGGLGGLFGALGGAFGGQNASSQKPIIRVRLRSAIDVPPRPTSEVQQSARRVLNVVSPRSGVRGVTVNMNGRTAILSGTVRSEKDRRMSELLMRLEPGVNQVDNRVVVGN